LILRPGLLTFITIRSTRTKLDVLQKPGEDRAGLEGSRIALGQTASGRYLRVVYIPEPDNVFVLTAFELTGKPLVAFRKRRKKKHQ
jgi:hypothetical protein